MMMPNRNWPLGMVLFLMMLTLLACAGYPGDPRTPQTGDDEYTLEEDTFLNVPADEGILVNDKAREGVDVYLLPESLGELDTEEGGIVNLADDGGFTYEPKADFFGTDSFSYTVRNEKGKQNTALVLLHVTAVNDPPRPVEDQVSTREGEPVTFSVLANDVEPDNDPMQVVSVDPPRYGTALVNGDDSITYTPQANHSGDVTFSYTVTDGQGGNAQGRIVVQITAVGPGIEVGPDVITVAEDSSITLPLSFLLLNDSDVQTGGPLTVVELGVPAPEHGTVVQNIDATFTYTPTPNYSGPDSFTYTVQSTSGRTASGMVSVTVEPSADPPTISDIADVTILQGESTAAIQFTIADPDTALELLSVSAAVTNSSTPNLIPAGGIDISTGLTGTRTIRITPDAALTGNATITVTVSDDEGNQASDSFVLTVTPVTPPTNEPPTITTIADQSVAADSAPISLDFTVGDDQTAPAALTTRATSSNQTLVPAANVSTGGAGASRTVTVAPVAGQSGNTTITVYVSDGSLEANVSFVLTVTAPTPVNTAPTISDIQDQNVPQGTAITVTFTIGDSETDPGELSVAAASSNQIGEISLQGTGADRSLLITPAADAQAGDSAVITVTVSDGALQASDTFTATITAGTTTSNTALSLLSLSDSAVLLSADAVSDQSGLLTENDIYSTEVDQTLTMPAELGPLVNDRGEEGQTLQVTPLSISGLNLNNDGAFTYMPPSGFVGRESFTYAVSDGNSTGTATVTFVVGGNGVPQAGRDGYEVAAGGTLSIAASSGLLANDRDPDSQALTVVSTGIYDTRFGGEVNIQTDGGFSYLPPLNFSGIDSFTYQVSDGLDEVVGVAEISVTD